MLRRASLAVVVVFVTWTLLDILIHGLLLGASYAATPKLWRPAAEMKYGLIHLVVLISAVVFVSIYAGLVAPKRISTGLQFGALYGVASGIGMGYGTYAVMPIPYHIALVWFLGTVAEATVAGLLVGWLVKERNAA